jgi:hypothetical protein
MDQVIVLLTVEPRLYSSKSLESSSSMSVYVEMGRSRDVRAETVLTKSDCAFPLSNMPMVSTPCSSGVMGVMACWGTVSMDSIARAPRKFTYHDGGISRARAQC